MTTNAIRGIRRKKSTLSEVKLAVIGAPGVGKTALTVRFLTKRYIGEYDHQSDNRYKHEMMVDGEPVIFEIMDTCSKVPGGDMPRDEVIQWADGFVLVYSITDRESFNFVKLAKGYIMEKKGGMSPGSYPQILVALLGNKGDMVHLRQVSTEEGDILAKDGDCIWAEVAAAEQVAPVADAFTELGRAVVAARKKNKQSLLDRMLGGKSGSGSGGSGVVGGAGVRMYSRGKSDSALPKNGF